MKAFDPLGALKVLLEHRVNFVLIGGLAARLHGSPTVTDDLDVCHSKERSNLEGLASALTEMHACLRLPHPDESVEVRLDWQLLHAAENFTFMTDFGALDCLALPAGVEDYEELRDGATVMGLDGIEIKVASIDHLMRMKRAAGRRKDLIELEILAALKEEIEGNPGAPH